MDQIQNRCLRIQPNNPSSKQQPSPKKDLIY